MAVYRISPDPDGTKTFQVEVEFRHLQVVAGFHTEAAAQEWITSQQVQTVKTAKKPDRNQAFQRI